MPARDRSSALWRTSHIIIADRFSLPPHHHYRPDHDQIETRPWQQAGLD